jgi:hypothetical protein
MVAESTPLGRAECSPQRPYSDLVTGAGALARPRFYGCGSGALGVLRLDFLWAQGQITVAGRQGLETIWDLSAHLLPDWTPREPLADLERDR